MVCAKNQGFHSKGTVMGYSTDFRGAFKCSKPLTAEQRAYLYQFQETRRMKRDAEVAETLPDPIRLAVGLPIGVDGCYFVGGAGFAGQGRDASIIEYNDQPTGQPGLWCQWQPDETGNYIGWAGSEKFYDYVEWLQYLVDHFLSKWGVTISGVIRWQGERQDDFGSIVVNDNVIERKRHVQYAPTHVEFLRQESCMYDANIDYLDKVEVPGQPVKK